MASAGEGGVSNGNRHLPGLRGDQASKAAQAQGRIIAHIDLDCFYVQVERSLNPDLKDKPVAVVQCKLYICFLSLITNCVAVQTTPSETSNPTHLPTIDSKTLGA